MKEMPKDCVYKSSWRWTLGYSKHVEDTIIKLCIFWFLLHRYITMYFSKNVNLNLSYILLPTITRSPVQSCHQSKCVNAACFYGKVVKSLITNRVLYKHCISCFCSTQWRFAVHIPTLVNTQWHDALSSYSSS
jgi:hypothetical protein